MIPKSRPYLRLQDLVAAVGFGRTRREFESALARLAGSRFGLAFAFGHSAFYALIQALELSGAEIILPAYTCDIMAEVVVRTGNVPVFVDIDLADFNMDLGALRSAITPRTRLILVTHMFGYPMDVDAVYQIADSPRILIVEDCALRLPTASALRGDVGLYSFGPGKPLFTVRGGALITNDAALHEKLRAYRDRQMARLPLAERAKRVARLMVTSLGQTDPGYSLALRLGLENSSYERSETTIPDSYNTAYADFQARIGLSLIGQIDQVRARRQALAARYHRVLEGIRGLIRAPILDGATYSYYTSRVPGRDAREFSQKMFRRSIQTGRTYDYAVACLDKYRSYVKSRFPRAEQAGREVANLPIHTSLSDAQMDSIAASIRQVLA